MDKMARFRVSLMNDVLRSESGGNRMDPVRLVKTAQDIFMTLKDMTPDQQKQAMDSINGRSRTVHALVRAALDGYANGSGL